jgi:RecA/RadA recombinase
MAKAKKRLRGLSLVKSEQYWIISQNYFHSNRKEIKERKFISTGVYILDAALSAKMLGGGISTNRISAFAGESGSGKSLAYSCSKNAQKDGYSIIYIDTEQAVDLEDFTKVWNPLDKFRLIRSNKVEDVNMVLTQLVDELKNTKLAGYEIPK